MEIGAFFSSIRTIVVSAFSFVSVVNACAQVQFFEDFESANSGQTLDQPPLNWTLQMGQPFGVLSNIHSDWPGLAVARQTVQINSLSGYTKDVVVPSSGVIELSFKCWAYTPMSGSASVGFAPVPYSGTRVELRFEDNSFLLVSGGLHDSLGGSLANATSYVHGYIDLTSLRTWMVVTNAGGDILRSNILDVPSGVRGLTKLWLYEDCRSGGKGMDVDNIKFQYLPPQQSKALSGIVTLQNYDGIVESQQVEVRIDDFESQTPDVYIVNLAADGRFSLTTMRQGNANISIKGSHWLRKRLPNVHIPVNGMDTVNLALINGDCDGDNEITLVDFGQLAAAFGTVEGDTNWNPNADLDGDGEVTLVDYSIAAAAFGQVGDE